MNYLIESIVKNILNGKNIRKSIFEETKITNTVFVVDDINSFELPYYLKEEVQTENELQKEIDDFLESKHLQGSNKPFMLSKKIVEKIVEKIHSCTKIIHTEPEFPKDPSKWLNDYTITENDKDGIIKRLNYNNYKGSFFANDPRFENELLHEFRPNISLLNKRGSREAITLYVKFYFKDEFNVITVVQFHKSTRQLV